MAIDMDKLQAFLGKFVTDLGATVAAGNVVIGHRLGLFKALAGSPATADELAARTGTSPRYVAEWLRGQAAGGYVEYDAAGDRYAMTEEQAFALTNPDNGVYAPGAFLLALGALRAEPRITEAFRTGAGLGWHEQDADVFDGCEQFFRPGYIAGPARGQSVPMASSSAMASAGSRRSAAARLSRRWATVEVPGMTVIAGDRWSSQASAACWAETPRAAATLSSRPDCSGENPPSGKNGA
jgi:hypothetical protein